MSTYMHHTIVETGGSTASQMTSQAALANNMAFPLKETAAPYSMVTADISSVAAAQPAAAAAVSVGGGGNTQWKMGKKGSAGSSGIVETETITVATARSAPTQEPAASKSNYLAGHKKITIKLEKSVCADNKKRQFITWLPSDDNSHRRTTQYAVGLQAGYGDSGSMGEKVTLENVADEIEQKDLKNIIESCIAVQVTTFGYDEDAVKAMMVEGKMWGFKACSKPTIEEIVWLKASNKNVHHAVGINFEQSGSTSKTKLTTVKYQSQYVKDKHFQIVVEPNVAQVVHSKEFGHAGKLLLNENRDEDDPFVVNGQCKELEEGKFKLEGTVTTVRLDDLDVLWGIANLSYIWPLYVKEILAELPATIDKYKQNLTVIELATSLKAADNNARISKKLTEVEEDEQLLLGEKISNNLTIMAENFAFSHSNSSKYFKLIIADGTPLFVFPGGLHHLIRREYNAVLERQGVFNGTDDLTITAHALKTTKEPEKEIKNEENNNVMVLFTVTAYYAQQGYAYLPLEM